MKLGAGAVFDYLAAALTTGGLAFYLNRHDALDGALRAACIVIAVSAITTFLLRLYSARRKAGRNRP